MLVSIIKYYLAIGFFDALIIKSRFRSRANWKIILLCILSWPWILIQMFLKTRKNVN